MKANGRALLLFSLSILVALAIVEVGLRVYFRFHTNYDIEMWRYATEMKQPVNDERSHIHLPSREAHLMDVDVRINSLGLRDREIPYEKGPGTYRILAIGDSVTFGWGIQFERSYAKQIEKNLRAEFPVEVLNLGIGNYNTEQELANFLIEGIKYRPDAVLLFYHVTDIEPTQKHALNFITKNSYIYAFLVHRWAQLKPFLFPQAHYVKFYQDLYHGEGWERLEPKLMRFADEAEARKIDLIPVVLPETRALKNYPFREMHDRLRQAFAKKGIELLDPLDLFLGKDPAEVMVAKDDPHPNDPSHQIIARFVAERLRERLRTKGVPK